ncbi:MAG: hypothetical protein IT437_08025 [Phycisphaerales bacterium]|nr:hypothetical protein [Phycisphaerales bacterium]
MKNRLLLSALFLVAVCSPASAALICLVPVSAMCRIPDDWLVADTYIVNDGEAPEFIGARKFQHASLGFLAVVKCSRVELNPDGYVKSFSPALPPLDGVALPDPNVRLASVTFDPAGRLKSWVMTAAPTPCFAYYDPNFGAYAFRTIDCAPPKECVIEYVQDPETGDITVKCPCSVIE